MVGFSVVTSSLMGGVVAIFIINSYILISKDRYVDSRMEYISFNSGSINTNKMSTRILLFYQFSVFIFSFMTRGSDYLMRLNLLQRDPEFIPNILLHGGQSVDSYVVINAHLFGFFIGLIISVIIMNWILIVKRKEYENRIKNSINI